MIRQLANRRPYLPSDEAVAVARDHILWLQLADREVGAVELLASMAIRWPHAHAPSWTDVLLVMAAWWDDSRAGRPYVHDRKVVALPDRRAA
ncbi:hypothetical protein SAMN06265365_1698 [Tistlia consotensis]|nr:hypothetical protein [Tistlia consotensis]SNS40637.1 hypothetical protein SAMN06265365_1698 [Tistlia consotensis]